MKRKIELIEVQSSGPQMNFSQVKTLLEKKGFEVGISRVDDFYMELLDKADAIKIPLSRSKELLDVFATVSLSVQRMGVFDVVLKERDQLYPRLILYEAFIERLAELNAYLDIRRPAYVVGDQALARVALGVLTHFGFSRIFIYGKNTSSMDEIVEKFEKQNFSLKISTHNLDEITQNQEIGGILVNTEYLQPGSEELEWTSYFNFLASDSLVLDVCDVKELNEEAQRAELKYIDRTQVSEAWARRVLFWLGV